jgi:hypothetical protein
MLKSFRISIAMLANAAALAMPAYAQQSARPNESPWAMRPPRPVPQAAATLSPEEAKAQKGSPEQQALARKVADAMVNKDYAAIRQAISPSTLKCIGTHDDFLQDRIKKQFALPMNRKFKLTINKLPPHVMNDNKYETFPMPATHLMGMQFDTRDAHATVNLPIGQEDGKWYEVQPCPTEQGMARFAKLLHMREQRRESAKAAIPNIKDPVRSQLMALIGKRDSVGAWRLCMSSLHYDFQMCHGIVSIMSGDETD